MKKKLFAETRHSPAEYHFSAEEWAGGVTWDQIGEWLEDRSNQELIIEELLNKYVRANSDGDEDAMERIAYWISQGVGESYGELLYHVWKYDKQFFDEEIETWAKEQEANQ